MGEVGMGAAGLGMAGIVVAWGVAPSDGEGIDKKYKSSLSRNGRPLYT